MPLNVKNNNTIKDPFENISSSSKRKRTLIETDRGKEFYDKIFQDFLNKKNIKNYSRNTSLGPVFAKRFNLTFSRLLKGPVFEEGDDNWVDVLPTIT